MKNPLRRVSLMLVVAVELLIGLPLSANDDRAFPGAKWEETSPPSQSLDAMKLAAVVDYLRQHSGRDGMRELVIVRLGLDQNDGGMADWTLSGGAAYVTDQTHHGQGSVQVRAHHQDIITSTTYRVLPAGAKDPGPADLVGGRVYTFSFYLKSLEGPKFAFSQIASYVKGAFGRNFAGAWFGSTRDGDWEECAVVFQIPTGEGITGLAVQAGANESTRPNSVAYVTDFRSARSSLGHRQPSSKPKGRSGLIRCP